MTAHEWLAQRLKHAQNRTDLVETVQRLARLVDQRTIERAFKTEMRLDGYFQKELPL